VLHCTTTEDEALPAIVRWRFLGAGAVPATSSWKTAAGLAGLIWRMG
jgi:hypothetical protein